MKAEYMQARGGEKVLGAPTEGAQQHRDVVLHICQRLRADAILSCFVLHAIKA